MIVRFEPFCLYDLRHFLIGFNICGRGWVGIYLGPFTIYVYWGDMAKYIRGEEVWGL